MILIIHENDKYTKQYLQYLADEGINNFSITLNDLIKKVEIRDFFSGAKKYSIWKLPERELNLQAVKSVYYNCQYPTMDYFIDFVEDDREYARQEWFSYILYILSTFKNVINPLPHQNISGCPFSLPRIYELSKLIGLEVPEWYFTSNIKNLYSLKESGEYAFKSSLHDYYSLSRSVTNFEDAILAVKLNKGAQVVAHVVRDEIYSNIFYKEGSETFNLPSEIARKCIMLTQKAGLVMAEIFLLRTLDNKYIIYYLSPTINWELVGKNKESFWEKLTTILLGEKQAVSYDE